MQNFKNMETLGEKINRLCVIKYTQKELAGKAGVTQATLSRIFSGTIKRPNPETLKAIAESLKINYDDLIPVYSKPSTVFSIQDETEFDLWCRGNGYGTKQFLALAIFILKDLTHEQRIKFLKRMESGNVNDPISLETSKSSDEKLGENILRDTQARIESLRKDKKPHKTG